MSKIKKIKKSVSKVPVRKSSNSPYFESLKRGDIIEIIAPGSYTSIEILNKGIEVLKNWGYGVICEENLLDPQVFLSNTDEKRFKSFKNAMTNKKSKAVWCLRGGYGSIRLLPLI